MPAKNVCERLQVAERQGYMEKVYKAMKSAGSWNLALGIILIVAGCVTGIMLIVSGAKLLKKKKDLLF